MKYCKKNSEIHAINFQSFGMIMHMTIFDKIYFNHLKTTTTIKP